MNTRKIIITLCFLAAIMLQWITNVEVVPHFQLYIPGVTYAKSSQTWVYKYTSGDVHFDTYDTSVNGRSKEKAVFAPFSHDAEGTGKQPIPEPATIALLSMGIVSMLAYKGRNFLRKA